MDGSKKRQKANKEPWRDFFAGPLFKLYLSYGFSSWGDRAWNFASSLALVCIWPNLRLAAISILIHCVSILMLGSTVGRWVDSVPRKTAAMICLLVNNTSVALSAGFFAACMYLSEYIWPLVIMAIIFSTIGNIGSTGLNIVITRDWLVVLCGKDPVKLARMNAVLLRINLSAAILSPILAGQIMASFSVAAGCLLICGWNLTSWIIESLLLNGVHNQAVSLAQKSSVAPSSASVKSENEPMVDAQSPSKSSSSEQTWVRKITIGWKEYTSHPAFAAGIGLALLYLTVLGLDSITTGYAYKQGVAENVLAAVRSVSAITGIMGSFAFPRLRKHYGLSRSGLIGLGFQTLFNSLCVVSIFLPGSPLNLNVLRNFTLIDDAGSSSSANFTNGYSKSCADQQKGQTEANFESYASIWTFLMGTVLARFGLWTADLAVTQIFQETTEESKRGAIGGVQHSLNFTMDFFKSVLVILLPDSETFGLLIIISFCAVVCGGVSLSIYHCKHGGDVSKKVNTGDKDPVPHEQELLETELAVLT